MFPLLSWGQSLRGQVAKKIVSSPVSHNKPSSSTFEPIAETDTVYSLSNKKQHGWFYPMQIVDLSVARRHGSYLMFTRKNATKHWTKMESFDGYGNHAWIGVSPYILNTNDPLGDSDWIKKIKKACIVEVVPDPSGETVIQERVYDKDMNLIYVFSHVPIGKNKYIGSYKDFYGLPAEMRKDTTKVYTYGTQVVITEDKWGNDSIVEFVDAKGVPKNNYDGVGMNIRIYDEKGNNIAFGSANQEGKFVLDNWGNCGWKIKYNSKGFPCEKICMNHKWEPMKMPNLRESGSSAGATRVLYKYDNYGRCIEERYMTMENQVDTNLYGAHYIEYKYDSLGNQTEITAYDKDGNLATFSQSGSAKEIYKYDNKGRFTYGEWYDKNNCLNSTEGYLCRRIDVYGDDDYLDEQVWWTYENGKEDTCYYYKRTVNSYYERWSDGSFKIDSLSSDGRKIFIAYYNADGSPKFYDDGGYHLVKWNYQDLPNRTIIKTIWLNADLEIINTRVLDVDSIHHYSWRTIYNGHGQKLSSVFYKWKDSAFDQIGQIGINTYGMHCRSGNGDEATFYTADYLMNHKGVYESYVGKDEFNEPEYYTVCRDNSHFAYYYRKTTKSSDRLIDYDENSNMIQSTDSLFRTHAWAMSVEVRDSMAYNWGLKDNDIILRYGNYHIDDADSTLFANSFKAHWEIESILESGKIKDVVVFRIDPDNKETSIVEMKLPEGTPLQLGFVLHNRILTNKQKDRLFTKLNEYKKHHAWNVNHDIGEKEAYIAMFEPNNFFCNKPYAMHVGESAIILAASTPETGKEWCLGQPTNESPVYLNNRIKDKANEQSYILNLYLSTDGKNIEKHTFTEYKLSAVLYNTPIPKSQYTKIMKLAKKAQKMMQNDNISIDKLSLIPLIIGNVETDGLAQEAGLKGMYVVLQYNKWKMKKGMDGIEDVITKGKEQNKHLVLLPIILDDNNNFKEFGKPLDYKLGKGLLGMRIFDWKVKQSVFNMAEKLYRNK